MNNLVTGMSALVVASVLLIAANNRAVVSAAPGIGPLQPLSFFWPPM